MAKARRWPWSLKALQLFAQRRGRPNGVSFSVALDAYDTGGQVLSST